MERMRLVVVSLLAAGAAVCMRLWSDPIPAPLWIPAALLGASALLVHHRHVGSQLVARAALWSNLGLGFLIVIGTDGREQGIAMALAVCTGGALLGLGQRGLDVDHGSFAPAAFRTTLFSLFLLALADVQGLAFFAALALEHRTDVLPVAVPLVLAGMLTVGLIGLYRLRVWGLAAHLVANLSLAGAVASGHVDLPSPILLALLVSATLQIGLLIPLFAALVRRRTRPNPRFSRYGTVVAASVVCALVGISIYAGAVLQAPLIHW
jgi:hypothetical protein